MMNIFKNTLASLNNKEQKSSIPQNEWRPETRSRRVQVLMPPSLHNELVAMAEATDESVNEQINKILDEYFSQRRSAPPLKKEENKSEKINLLVTPSTKAKLIELGKEYDESLNDIVNTILEGFCGVIKNDAIK
ncbi:MAG: hypothetical protein E6041_05245 [Escherichia coli]|uniref:hypothetical protein n=1 Tax=Negativicoccus succinicivorans TaxID=620903 RepID=UPI002911C39A|nr:hypothetical protein [Negativicoccus succinicivorans]MDU5530524.1 hypothetical protein [Negativicoccus succinicivorans]MDU5591243.1 hypothetical protein [Escherichia coli]